LQELHGIISQKTAFFIVIAVKTSSLTTPLLAGDMLSSVFLRNGLDIFDAGACFVAMETFLLPTAQQWTTFLGPLF
jgi:hypothetical protein